MIGAAFFLLLCAIPLALGVILVVRSKQRGHGYPACGGCGYDVSGSMGSVVRCPECGALFTEVGITPPRGRRNRTMLVCGIILLAVFVSCLGTGGIAMFAGTRAMTRGRQNAQQILQAEEAQEDASGSAAPAAGDPDEPGDQ